MCYSYTACHLFYAACPIGARAINSRSVKHDHDDSYAPSLSVSVKHDEMTYTLPFQLNTTTMTHTLPPPSVSVKHDEMLHTSLQQLTDYINKANEYDTSIGKCRHVHMHTHAYIHTHVYACLYVHVYSCENYLFKRSG